MFYSFPLSTSVWNTSDLHIAWEPFWFKGGLWWDHSCICTRRWPTQTVASLPTLFPSGSMLQPSPKPKSTGTPNDPQLRWLEKGVSSEIRSHRFVWFVIYGCFNFHPNLFGEVLIVRASKHNCGFKKGIRSPSPQIFFRPWWTWSMR